MRYILTIIAIGFSSILFAQDASVPVDVVAPVVDSEIPAILLQMMAIAKSVPVLGPIAVEVAKYLGLVASLLTILVTAILAAIRSLQVALPLLKLASLAAKIAAFEKSKVMYYLKFFSVYNAKKDS